jgi:adhesin transport system outer membrane protein
MDHKTEYRPRFRPTATVRLLLIATILAMAPITNAAEASLHTLMELAAVQHPSILQARDRLEAARFDVEGAKWGRFPTIISETRAPSNNTQSLTKVEQPLWTGGRISAQIDLSEANRRIARDQLQEAELNVLLQLSGAYFELLRMQVRLKAADENVAEHSRLEALIGRRVAAEVSPAADLVLANARLQQAIGERIQLVRLRDAARVALQQWSLSQVTVAKPLRRIDVLRSESARITDDDLVGKALAYSPQRRRLQHQLEAARAQRELAFSQGMPTVLAGYQHVWGGTSLDSGDRGTTYIALQFQPGAGLTALTNRQAAARREDAARQELVGLEREITAQVQTLLSEIDAANAQLAPARTLLKGSAEVVDSYLRQYQVGRRNWVEVLNALREKSQAAFGLADIEQARDQAQVRLLITAGELAPTNLKAIGG